MSGRTIDIPNRDDSLAGFEDALRALRNRVYDYLDNWPGAASFQPQDIHDGLFSYVRHRGKGLRPSLLMLCVQAVGGDAEQAIPAAAAVEIFHIWTLVHDDIIDRDDLRRGSPTVHVQYARHAAEQYKLPPPEAAHYGTAVAILSGDLQQSWAYALLSDLEGRGIPAGIVLKLIRRMASKLTPALLEGEMLDVQFAITDPAELTEKRILDMLSGKSAALLEYAAWAGATIGLGNKVDEFGYADQLGQFALLCGLAFQIHDDVLGLTADAEKLGKPVGSDLREGKRTLLVQHALEVITESERSILLETIGRADATDKQTTQALDIIKRSGAIEYVTEMANKYISHALGILDALPHTSATKLLRQWATFMLARTY